MTLTPSAPPPTAPGELGARDEDALALLRAAARRRAETHGAAVVVHPYAPGHLGVALAGGPVAELEALLRDSAARLPSASDVVIDLTELQDAQSGTFGGLARQLGHLRIRALVAGARVQLRGAPPALTRELGGCAAEEFDVSATTGRRTGPGAPD